MSRRAGQSIHIILDAAAFAAVTTTFLPIPARAADLMRTMEEQANLRIFSTGATLDVDGGAMLASGS